MGSAAFPIEARPHTSGPEALPPRSGWRRDAAICVLLGIVAFLIYNANLRVISASDTYAARYLPFSIWRHHTLVLDPIVTSVAQGRRVPDTARWIVKGRGDHFVSLYPVVVPVVLAPLYLPVIAYFDRRGWEPLQLDGVARIMEKLCASLLAAASVMLVYLLLRRRSDPVVAALLTLVFAFGTTTWVISSQALWMHGLGELAIAATLLLLTGPCTPVRAVAAGFVCALVACNRQPDAVLAAGLGLYGLWWAGRRIPLFLAAGALPVGLVLAYNLGVVGHVAGAYALAYRPTVVQGDVLAGVAGLLFSPTHGLFVFSPFLLFVPCCLPLVLRDRSARGLTAAIGGAVVPQLIVYGIFVDWRQGVSFGPRWLTDMLPMLVWMLPPVVVGLSVAGRVAFGFACAVAIAIEVIGAFWYTGVSDAAVLAAAGPDRMRAAWDIRNASFIAELSHPRAPADLVVDLRGSIDLATVRDGGGDKAERQVEVQGWALTNSRSPAEVHVLVDGRLTAGTASFFERPDVMRALGATSPSGWKVTFPADHLAPGEHVFAVLVRAYAGAEPRLLQERTFSLAADNEGDRRDRDLANAARLAAKALAEHQQSAGYWLTRFTDTTRFEHPRPEMNTFLNAVMIDVAAPVAEQAGLAGPLGRARDFLASQIEADGLVRYHGRPDAPTIGTLGCAITPDADDTALVWRVAPGEHPELLPAALATLGRFRTADGLYRTWLAPRDRYACIDPGQDPNPADIAIQMHVLMLLAQADPPAARTLCEALRKRSADEDIWVYYKMAPPIVVLRLIDVRKAGCPLELPQARLQAVVPGQEVWIEATRLVQLMDSADSRDAASARATELLRKLAADDFSLIARAPPLLYHNDLTASVRRFYWSEDLGYALWLRLYVETERARSGLSCREGGAGQQCGGK
jgi:hypothetical protein